MEKETIIDAGKTKHEVVTVEDSGRTLPYPCKACGKEIQTGWNDMEGYCRACWNETHRKLLSVIKGFLSKFE